ncbi:unnamed protein product, partial [Polarella glacialis]
DLPRQQLQPDMLSFNSVIAAAAGSSRATNGGWRQVCQLIQEMRVRMLSPDLVSYNAALMSNDGAGGFSWWQAASLLASLSSEMLRPSVLCLGAVLATCERRPVHSSGAALAPALLQEIGSAALHRRPEKGWTS